MKNETEGTVEASHDDMLALLDRLERENPTVAATTLDREVDKLLGRPSFALASAKLPPATPSFNDAPVPRGEDSPFAWYNKLLQKLPPVMSSERSIAAARAVEIGLFAQERLDTTDRATMTRIEILDLRRLAEHGRKEYELLILSNLRLVFHWSRWVTTTIGEDWLQDAFQAGVFGLIRGIQGWDHNMGFTLSTYVSWHIRQQIQRWRMNETLVIRIPVHVWERLQSIQEEDADPTEQAALRLFKVRPLDDVLEDDPSLAWDGGLDESIEKADWSHAVEAMLSVLTAREAHVLKLRHGLTSENGEFLTLDAIGEIYGVTRERIRQIESKAIKKITESNVFARLVDAL